MYMINYQIFDRKPNSVLIASMPGMQQLEKVTSFIHTFPDLEELIISDYKTGNILYDIRKYRHDPHVFTPCERAECVEKMFLNRLLTSCDEDRDRFKNCREHCKDFVAKTVGASDIPETMLNLCVQFLYDLKVPGGVERASTGHYLNAFLEAFSLEAAAMFTTPISRKE